MKRLLSILAVSVAAFTAVPAFADGHRAHGFDPAAFPMKAADFQAKMEQRLTEKKAHIEKRIADQKLDAAKAKEMRDRFNEHATKLRAAVAEAAKDGVITADEAKALRPHHGHHGKHDGSKAKK